MARGAIKFKHVNVPRQQGEIARLKIVQGPDQGAVFVLVSSKVTLGRGEDNDIVLSDLKASRNHAELLLQSSNGAWVIKDKGSSNGILYKEQYVRTASLSSHDVLTFGETALEFMTSDEATRFLISAPRPLDQIRAEQVVFEKQKQRVRALANMGSKGLSSVALGGVKKKPSPLLIGAAAIGLIVLMLPEQEVQKKQKKAPKGPASLSRDLASYLPQESLTGESALTAETYFKSGFREYRSRNFLRAKSQFEIVLQMSPGHRLATLYLDNCEKSIQDEITDHLTLGKRSSEFGKLKGAKYHFEAVMRLLERDQANPAYSDAKRQHEEVMKRLTKESRG
jgi:pSer/pThr/pTyr-binding forkhead associated (FHA) protein